MAPKSSEGSRRKTVTLTVCVVVNDDVREKKSYKATTEHVFVVCSFSHFFHLGTYDHQRVTAQMLSMHHEGSHQSITTATATIFAELIFLLLLINAHLTYPQIRHSLSEKNPSLIIKHYY